MRIVNSKLTLDEKLNQLLMLFREGKLSYEDYQKKLDVLLGVETPFFKNFLGDLSELVQDRIPCKAKEEQFMNQYWNRRDRELDQLIKTHDWVYFWENCDWLQSPTLEDKKYLQFVNIYDLREIFLVILYSLRQYQNSDLESSPKCSTLYECFKVLKPEINQRQEFIQLPEEDPFLEYSKNKQSYQQQQNLEEKARKTGKICFHCGSKDVVSDGHSWKCKNCGKYFRKW